MSLSNAPLLLVQIKRRKWGVMVKYTISLETSLYLFTLNNPLRRFCVYQMVVNPYFDYFIIFTILANCVFMAMNDPPLLAE